MDEEDTKNVIGGSNDSLGLAVLRRGVRAR